MSAERTVASVVKAAGAGKPAGYAATIRKLRAVVKAAVPGAKETINPWGLLSFERDGPLAVMLVAAKHVSLVFMRGTALPDPAGLLEGTGKDARHVKLRTPADVERPAAVAALVKASAALNRSAPGTAMGAKKKPRAKSG